MPNLRDTLFRDHPWLEPAWHAERLSPNHGERRGGSFVSMIVLHYTGMVDAASALDRLCDPASEVSCHYLIEENGTVWHLVEESRRAWHAGTAFWAGERDINSRSIGIELVNPGHEHGYRPFPEVQMEILAELCHDIIQRQHVRRHRVLGHSDVAPARKTDPGELFDWAWLAERNIGLYPGFDAPAPAIDPAEGLRRIGYEVAGDTVDPATVIAFQRHFRPRDVSGALDDETCRRIAQLVHQLSHI